MIKCWVCSTKADHRFKDCISTQCNCVCVQELQRMYTNAREVDVKPVHPRFLKIENGKIKALPSVDKEIAEFNHIRKNEWLPKKKDKRFRKK